MYGKRIKQLRNELGMTQTELSVKSGIRQGTIARYENERIEPTLTALKALADALNTTIDYIAGKSDIKEPWVTENELMNNYRLLSEEDKKYLIKQAVFLRSHK